MIRKMLICCLVLVLALTCLSIVNASEADLVGTFSGTSTDGQFREIWTIRLSDKGEWSATCIYKKDNKQVGACHGKDYAYANGSLSFAQVFDKKPDPGWKDGAVHTVKGSGDKLTYVWKSPGGSGTVTLWREKSGAELVGAWRGASGDGRFKETWTISRSNKGEWSASCIYLKGDKEAGASHGKDYKYADGSLTFALVFDKKPEPSWKDGAVHTVRRSADKLSYVWKSPGGSGTVTLESIQK
jgi:predicted secreted protein